MCWCRVSVEHVSDTGTRLIQGVYVLHSYLQTGDWTEQLWSSQQLIQK